MTITRTVVLHLLERTNINNIDVDEVSCPVSGDDDICELFSAILDAATSTPVDRDPRVWITNENLHDALLDILVKVTIRNPYQVVLTRRTTSSWNGESWDPDLAGLAFAILKETDKPQDAKYFLYITTDWDDLKGQKALVKSVNSRLATLEATVGRLRDENAHLRGNESRTALR
jgi:hypothetical protein